MKNDILLKLAIEEEVKSKHEMYSEADDATFQKMIVEINNYLNTDFHYLSEFDFFDVKGSGEIINKYIDLFESETIRACLMQQLVYNKVANCASTVLRLYLHFKASDEYIAKKNESAPAPIYVRYDNAIRKLKPKSLKKEILELAYCPRDVFYLPLTMVMLASWKQPEMEDLLVSYLNSEMVTAKKVGLPENAVEYYPSLESIQRQIKFTAIAGLKYYPSVRNEGFIRELLDSQDKDISVAATKTMKYYERYRR